MSEHLRPSGSALPSSATSPAEEASRLEQALEDLDSCEGASVSLVHCASAARERTLVRALATAARTRKFLTATVSLREHALDSPDLLVAQVLGQLVPPSETRARGLLWVLDRFYDDYGDDSAATFARAARSYHAHGDLTELCRGYLATAEPTPAAELRAYEAWLAGEHPPKKYRNPAVRGTLNERTAQRALTELTRVVRALDHRGLLVILAEGDAIASRTERQREKAYTLLRELVDNFDGADGAVSTRVIITGGAALFEGQASIQSIRPLYMRLQVPSDASPAPPHRSSTSLTKPMGAPFRRKIHAHEKRSDALGNLVRISEGLPPTHRVTRMSVGAEKLDRTVARLFSIVKRGGSFFSTLVGDYGSGKTHMMMHLAERAIEDQRPVFWLNLERTNLDLGNPARHFGRLLEHSELPLRGRPSALSLVQKWTRSTGAVAGLVEALETIAGEEGHAAIAARKALRGLEGVDDRGTALEVFLSGADLRERPGDKTYRADAYRRLFLWLELLARKEEIRGPVILIDEAENLYTSGRPPASRRTSLRSLAFYCGGALPGTCVILGITPPAFEELKGEARALLEEAGEQESTLELENVERFRKSLWGLKADPVRALSRNERIELCERIRRMHRSARGRLDFDDWDDYVQTSVKAHSSPRTLIRAVVDELESRWWAPHSRR